MLNLTVLQVLSSAAYLYDAVLHYAYALNASISKGNGWNNVSAVTSIMYKTSFTGKLVLVYLQFSLCVFFHEIKPFLLHYYSNWSV